MRVLNLHSWDVSTSEAGNLQRDLATKVVRSRCLHSIPRYIAGTDLSVDRIHRTARAAAVVVEYPSLHPVEVRTVEGELTWPYVPGFLSFREAPLSARRSPRIMVPRGQWSRVVPGPGTAAPGRARA